MTEPMAYAVLSHHAVSTDEKRNIARELTRHVCEELGVHQFNIQFVYYNPYNLAFYGVLAVDEKISQQ